MFKSIKKVVLLTGLIGMTMFGSPFIQDNPIMDFISNQTTITAMAAEQENELPYSKYWETQADGSWKYKRKDGVYAKGWILDEVDGNYYYMDSNGVMQSGLYQSYGRYYLLSELHDGHYGHMLTNGEVYKGVTIKAEPSGDFAGALSEETIKQLGLDTSKAPDISGSSHNTNGEETPPAPAPKQEQNKSNETSSSSGQTSAERSQSQRDKYGEGSTFSVDDSEHPLS